MFPLRFMRGQIQENRDLALSRPAPWVRQAFATGAGTAGDDDNAGRVPGSVYGTCPGDPRRQPHVMLRPGHDNLASRVASWDDWHA